MDDVTVPVMLILFVGMPAVIGHYLVKLRQMKGISAEDEASLGDLRTSADRLEERLRTMERILDDEIPDWRSRHHDKL